MPIRNNHPSLTKSVTIYGVYANQYTTYDGSSLWQFAPSTNGTYNISSGTWTRLQFRQSASSYGYTWSSTISIPPSTTHCVMQMTSNYYYTSNGGYWFLDWNAFYNLDVTFADNYIEVDPRLIETLRFADFRKYGMTSTSVDNFYRTYTAAASLYGDR